MPVCLNRWNFVLLSCVFNTLIVTTCLANQVNSHLLQVSSLTTPSYEYQLEEYQRISGVSGTLNSVGSDTLANMMTLWAEAFQRHYPSVNVQVQAAGSSTAPPALTEGTASFGPMSRKMKSRELEAFRQRFGYEPTAVPVAVDALAVFVHQDNPLHGLTVQQVDSLFSINRRCGGTTNYQRWGDLGLSGSWKAQHIQLFGRNSVSGTYGYFKQQALCQGDFKNTVNEQPGSASVVQSIASSVNSIGYSGIGYLTSGVRAVSISIDGENFIKATQESAASGKYPFSRLLYIYINKHPNQLLDPMQAEFIRFILSKEGQEIVTQDGYVKVPSAIVHSTLKNLGL